ncbi:hypothetical protein [Mycolicibacterium gadium]|nr:hypothetical protein [Mycolicibacterium gadium]
MPTDITGGKPTSSWGADFEALTISSNVGICPRIADQIVLWWME